MKELVDTMWYGIVRDMSQICLVVIVMVIATSCSSLEHGPYNRDKEQDLQCYSRFGGQYGFCDKGGRL